MVASPDRCIPDADELASYTSLALDSTSLSGAGAYSVAGKFVGVFRFGGLVKTATPTLLGCGHLRD